MNSENKPSSDDKANMAAVSLRTEAIGGMVVGLMSMRIPGRPEPDEMTIGTIDRAFVDMLPDPQAGFNVWRKSLSDLLAQWGEKMGGIKSGEVNMATGDRRPEPGEPGHHITTLDGVETTTAELVNSDGRVTNVKIYIGNNIPDVPLLHVLRLKHGDDLLDVVRVLEEAAGHLRVIAGTNQQRAINAIKQAAEASDGQARH
jgi:hypothetical protein